MLRIDFNALPSSVSWDLEEAPDDAGGADSASDAVHTPIRNSTLENDTLKRMDIYGCPWAGKSETDPYLGNRLYARGIYAPQCLWQFVSVSSAGSHHVRDGLGQLLLRR